MGTKQLILFGAVAAVALLCATCAPVEAPVPTPDDPTHASVDVTKDKDVIVLPPPRVSGPEARVDAAIRNVSNRDLLTTNGFWTIFHGILGMGFTTTLLDPETGKKVNAIDYICDGGELRGLNFIQTKHGLDVQIGPVSVGQGHQDQFVAEMTEWGMTPERKFIVQGKEYTFKDFINHSRMRARVTANQELSWAIIMISQFYGLDHAWTNMHGEKLRFEDVVRYELDQTVEGAACGGTHRLWGLTWAYHLHLRQGGKPVGVYKEIAEKTVKYRDLAKKYQNADGSFSTDFFSGPGNADDPARKITTTGHMLEWLSFALTDEELKEEWVGEAANALSRIILNLRDEPIEGGALYHAVHGLKIYYTRLYEPQKVGTKEMPIPLPPGWTAGK
jgi:hypothetical protein